MSDDCKFLHRFYETHWSEHRLMLIHAQYPVLKETKTGAWIDYHGYKKFVKRDARKRFACPTAEEALESYHARKRRQISILRWKLAEAEAALSLTKDSETTYFGMPGLDELL